MPNKKYQIIYAVQPWSFGNCKLNTSTSGKEITNHYSVMSDIDILNLSIQNLADDNCLLFLWVVYNKLPLALECINKFCFKYSTTAFESLTLHEAPTTGR